jgi:5-deoxy-glucuronate isomerase
MCWAETQEEREPCLITPASSKIEIRGGGHATRQINSIVAPGVAASKLVSVEVYTPGGNWSSYPPHKHDAHKSQGDEVTEAELEELYFYKFRQKEGFAFQRVYTADGTLDQTLTPRNNDIVLVPRGYHPVSAAPGYDCYYLNFLAGSSQSLACSDDPDHSWVKQTWSEKDPRLPLVSHAMEERQSASLTTRQTR